MYVGGKDQMQLWRVGASGKMHRGPCPLRTYINIKKT